MTLNKRGVLEPSRWICRLPPGKSEKAFRQSHKQFVIMTRNAWSLHQNYIYTTDLTKTAPRTRTAPMNLPGIRMNSIQFHDRNFIENCQKNWFFDSHEKCGQRVFIRCKDCDFWVDYWLTFMVKVPSWLKPTANKNRRLRRRLVVVFLAFVAGKCYKFLVILSHSPGLNLDQLVHELFVWFRSMSCHFKTD